jgi:hypothetical protein
MLAKWVLWSAVTVVRQCTVGDSGSCTSANETGLDEYRFFTSSRDFKVKVKEIEVLEIMD